MLNTYIYYQLLPTCFDVCCTIFRKINALCSKTIRFLQCCYEVYIIPFFNLQSCYIV